MIRQFFLFILMAIPLLAALMTATPVPVLVAMGGLILFGITVAPRGEPH